MRVEEARRIRISGSIIAGVGALIVVVAVWFGLWLPVYLVALGVMALGFLRLSTTVPSDRGRKIALVATVLAVVVAVAAPWRLAAVERSGNPQWEVKTAGIAGDIFSDGSRVLFLDDDGLHAVDLRDGAVQWSLEGRRATGAFHVAADGHVLAQFGDSVDTRVTSWISPEGEVLWSISTPFDSGSDLTPDGRAFDQPIATADGNLVVATCDDRAEPVTCRYIGIGPDGAEIWSRDGQHRPEPATTYSRQNLSYTGPREIPDVTVVHAVGDPTDGGLAPAALVDPVDGSTITDIEVGETLAVVGDMVVYDAGPAAEAGFCRTRGLSAAGDVSWTRDAPCLSAGVTVLGTWIYGNMRDVSASDGTGTDDELIDSFAMDPATGHWRRVGPLADISGVAADRAGVPGTDIVVQRHGHQLTGIDPESGKEGWTLDVPSGSSIPGVEAAHGAAAVLYRPTTGRNPFSAGEERTRGMGLLAIDTRTGRVTGSYFTPGEVWTSVPVAPGQVLIGDEDRIFLIGSRSQ